MNKHQFRTAFSLLVSGILGVALTGCAAENTETDLPEDVAQSEESLSKAYMSCYVDTPALDVYEVDDCFGMGTSNTIASFKLTTSTKPSSVVWYGHPECTGSVCNVSIRPGQTISLGAYYIVNGIPTLGASATARYETPY